MKQGELRDELNEASGGGEILSEIRGSMFGCKTVDIRVYGGQYLSLRASIFESKRVNICV